MPEPRDEVREDELFRGAVAGDHAAYEALIADLRPLQAHVVRRRLADEADIDDVIQQTPLRGWQQLHTFSGRASFRSWIAWNATHGACNFVRDRRSFEPVELEDVPAFTSSLNTARQAAGQVWERVRGHLAEMPPKQRLVMELRLFHEMDFEEIGAIADRSERSARVPFHQGLERIRGVLGERPS